MKYLLLAIWYIFATGELLFSWTLIFVYNFFVLIWDFKPDNEYFVSYNKPFLYFGFGISYFDSIKDLYKFKPNDTDL